MVRSAYDHGWQSEEATFLAPDGIASTAFYVSRDEEASFGASGRGQPLGKAKLVPPDAPGYSGVLSREAWPFVGATVVTLGVLCVLQLILFEAKATSRTQGRLAREVALAVPSAALLGTGILFGLIGLGYNV